jgi:HAD superfamily hydrolase (TIGR01509 family)
MLPLTISVPVLHGVVFDLDGVIVDSHATHRTAWRHFLRMLGREVPEPELDFILDGRKRYEILRHFLGDLTEEELAHYGKCKDRIFQGMQSEVPPLPGVVPLIRDLHQHGIAIALASSASPGRAHSMLSRLNIKNCFRVIVTADDVAAGKPDPASYRLAAERLYESPSSLLAVEDAVSGVQAATAAGFMCLAVANPQNRQSLLAAGAFETIPDFAAVSVRDLVRMHQNCAMTIKTE